MQLWDYERMAGGITTGEIRTWVTALPQVTEKQHFRFKVPVWQVRGKTFLGMGREPTYSTEPVRWVRWRTGMYAISTRWPPSGSTTARRLTAARGPS